MLDWVAMPSFRGSSLPRDWTHVSGVSCFGRWVLYHHLGSPANDIIHQLRLWASLVAQMARNLPVMWETRVWSPGLEDPLLKGTAYPLQYSGLENSMDRGAWQAIVHGVAKSRTPLSNFHFQLRLGLEPMGLGLEHSQNPVFQLRSQHLVSGPNEAQVLDVSSQKEFSARQSDR